MLKKIMAIVLNMMLIGCPAPPPEDVKVPNHASIGGMFDGEPDASGGQDIDGLRAPGAGGFDLGPVNIYEMTENFQLEAPKACNFDITDQELNEDMSEDINRCEFFGSSTAIEFLKVCDDQKAVILYQDDQTLASEYHLVIYQKAEKVSYKTKVDVKDPDLNIQNLGTPKLGHVICDRNNVLLHLRAPTTNQGSIDQIMHLRLPNELKAYVKLEHAFIKSPEMGQNSSAFNQPIRNFQSLIPSSTSLLLNEGFFSYTPPVDEITPLNTQDLSLKRLDLSGLDNYDLSKLKQIRLNDEVITYVTTFDRSIKKIMLFRQSENANDFRADIDDISLSDILDPNDDPELFATEKYLLYYLKKPNSQSLWYSETLRDGEGVTSKIKAISRPRPISNLKTEYIFHAYQQFIVYEDPNLTTKVTIDAVKGEVLFRSFLKIYDLKNNQEISLKNVDRMLNTRETSEEFPIVIRTEDKDGNPLITPESRIFIDEDDNSYYINVVSSSPSGPKIYKYAFKGIDR